MFKFFVNAEGGLTAAGYGVCIVAGIVLFIAALIFAGKVSEKKKMGTKQLVFCAMALALAFITSYIKLFNMPWGGSVTLCSMLFIVLTANWYGRRQEFLWDWYTGFCSLFRSRMCCPSSRCAAIIFLLLRRWECRLLRKEKTRADCGIYCGGNCKRRLPRSGRLSLLDELYAEEFPTVSEEPVSDPV